ncbi:hypothetical protein CZP2022_129 [Vibrio phage C-ZP2022]|nr:hypothetical protein CZP2022_129 [Vibrio phage C-ZP2022]
MDQLNFSSLSDQAQFVYNATDMAKPVLPLTAGNAMLVKEFLFREPKSDIRIDFREGHYRVNNVYEEGVGYNFELVELDTQQHETVSLAILSQEKCEMDVRTVNGFNLFLQELGAERILL